MNLRKTVFVATLFSLCSWTVAHAAADLQVTPSSTEIGEDENVSVEFKTSTDDYNARISRPQFDAPDFDEVNVYQGMTGIQSSFIDGAITVKRTQGVTVVLHPRKTGKLAIRNVRVIVNGKPVHAPDIAIDVAPAGAASRQRGGGGFQYGQQGGKLPGSGVRPSKTGSSSFFLKTEPDKLKAYKGEQIILTYALYTQVQILGVQIERYPSVSGFLKEDLDNPQISNRLQYSRSVVGGREYNRAVLVQYAVFPLREGNLAIDALTGKFSYRVKRAGRGDDDDDPFGMLNQFFNSMQTSTDTRSSDRVSIEVLPLPAAGQPRNFTGLVGDFDVTAMADRYSLKAGEPLNVKVKVEGRGHAGSLEHLNVDWPKDFELYEDKSSTQFQRTGRSERIFDFMLVPKVKGRYQIPPVELSMFNPESGRYQVKKTAPIEIDVQEGTLGSVYIAKGKPAEAKPESKEDIRYWMASDEGGTPGAGASARATAAKATAAASLLFAAYSVLRLRPNEAGDRRRVEKLKSGKAYRERVQGLIRIDHEPSEVLAKAEAVLAEIVQTRYGVSIGSLTRPEVRQQLAERPVEDSICKKLESLMERCENFRFVPGGAQPQAARQVVDELIALIDRIYGRIQGRG
ncbi:MAG: protein BatD [Deltaproteobacteria bacterium]|nr:protein BatD [Deltaproteobacteria bacterium]